MDYPQNKRRVILPTTVGITRVRAHVWRYFWPGVGRAMGAVAKQSNKFSRFEVSNNEKAGFHATCGSKNTRPP